MTYQEKIDKAIDFILAHVKTESCEGLTDDELHVLEFTFMHRLPDAYRYFLKRVGKYRGKWLARCSVFYPEFIFNRGVMFEDFVMLMQAENITLSDYYPNYSPNNFVFFRERETDSGLCFDINECFSRDPKTGEYIEKNPDPPVYWMAPVRRPEAESFSDWVYSFTTWIGQNSSGSDKG